MRVVPVVELLRIRGIWRFGASGKRSKPLFGASGVSGFGWISCKLSRFLFAAKSMIRCFRTFFTRHNVLVTIIPSRELVLQFGLTEGGVVIVNNGDMGRTR